MVNGRGEIDLLGGIIRIITTIGRGEITRLHQIGRDSSLTLATRRNQLQATSRGRRGSRFRVSVMTRLTSRSHRSLRLLYVTPAAQTGVEGEGSGLAKGEQEVVERCGWKQSSIFNTPAPCTMPRGAPRGWPFRIANSHPSHIWPGIPHIKIRSPFAYSQQSATAPLYRLDCVQSRAQMPEIDDHQLAGIEMANSPKRYLERHASLNRRCSIYGHSNRQK